MPRYDYECSGCGNRFEVKQGFHDEPVASCPECGDNARRKFHAVPIIYKGSGFYTTDYGKSSVSANGTSGAPSEDAKPEGAKEDKKPDPKPAKDTKAPESPKANTSTST